MEISVIKTESSSPNLIHVFGRDINGNARHIRIKNFRPYFYIPIEDAPDKTRLGKIDRDVVYRSIEGRRLAKFTSNSISDLFNAKQRFIHYEGDVPLDVRFLIDSGVKTGIRVLSDNPDFNDVSPIDFNTPARICYLDIECDDSCGFPSPKHDKIVCLTCFDSFDNDYMTFIISEDNHQGIDENHIVISCKSEMALLRSFIYYIKEKNPDVITGWNLAKFDIPYLKERMDTIGVNSEDMDRIYGKIDYKTIKGRVIFDLLPAYKKMQLGEKESYRLDAIAVAELGISKIEHEESIYELWCDNKEKLIAYNYRDVELCHKLDVKGKIIEFFTELANYVGCSLENSLFSTQVLDIYILRKSKGIYVLPSKKHETECDYKGATVFEPIHGLHEDVAVLDIKSLYPMAMMTLNASPETKSNTGELVSPNGIRFRSQPDGLFRKITMELLNERDEKKKARDACEYGHSDYDLYDLQQNAIKVIMNSLYGASAYSKFRLYDASISAAITATGREIIDFTRKMVEELGFEVIYGDTDSTMVKLKGDNIIETGYYIASKINKGYDSFAKECLNADKHWFSIKFEKLYKRYFQTTKKRYAGLLIWKEGQDVNKLDVTGYEFKRSNYPKITKETQGKVFEMLLNGRNFDEIRVYLGEVITRIRKGEIPIEDISIPRGIENNLDLYERPDTHIRGAIYANTHLGESIRESSKPKRIHIKRVTGKFPTTDVVSMEYPEKLPKEFIVDYETMMIKTVRNPIEQIINELGYVWADVDPEVKTLADFGL